MDTKAGKKGNGESMEGKERREGGKERESRTRKGKIVAIPISKSCLSDTSPKIAQNPRNASNPRRNVLFPNDIPSGPIFGKFKFVQMSSSLGL